MSTAAASPPAYDLVHSAASSEASPLVSLAEQALAARVTDGRLASLTLEIFALPQKSQAIGARLHIERETRTLVFAAVDIHDVESEMRLATVQALLRRNARQANGG